MKRQARFLVAMALVSILVLNAIPLSAATQAPNSPIRWKLQYEELFDTPVPEPDEWVEDTYEDQDDPYFGEKGLVMLEKAQIMAGDEGPGRFLEELESFSSYRKSYSFGEDDWLTIEAYGRGADSDTPPETGGRFIINGDGKAVLECISHNDAAVIGSTNPLPATYRLEVTVSNIDVGGKVIDENGNDVTDKTPESWTIDGRLNGYYQDGIEPRMDAGPWRTNNALNGLDVDQNGAYFLSIVDYANPKPHNNVFIHHHRKVAMDTDNNLDFNMATLAPSNPWSYVWNGNVHAADGSRYISMLWLNGNARGATESMSQSQYLSYLHTGNPFYTYTQVGPTYNTTNMVDKYLPGEEYVFAIERTPEYYTLSVSGNFFYGGNTTYEHTKYHLPDEANGDIITWHFNQTIEELQGITPPSDTRTYQGETVETWPEDAVYPDYFFFGNPHINYYAGSVAFSNLRLYVPEDIEPVRLTTDAHNLQAGDYFTVNASFHEEQPSNTVILNYSFDADKFEYANYSVEGAEGVNIVDREHGAGWAKITLMIQDYDAENLGDIMLRAKEDAPLVRERQYVSVAADYVLRDENGDKTAHDAEATVGFTTLGDGEGGPGLPGDTNDDGVVDILDLSNMIDWFGYNPGNQEDWHDWYTYFDFNNNGEIDISDIAYVARLI